jgi:hypothetical protein
MRHLVYAFDSAPDARRAVDMLLHDGLREDRLAVVARPDVPLEEFDGMREVAQDFTPAVGRGIAAGAAAGLVAGLAATAIPALGISIAAAPILWSALGGGLIGAWTSALIGASVPDRVRRTFEDEIAKGNILLRIDAKADDVHHISQLLGDAFPQHLMFQRDLSALHPKSVH